MPNVETILNGYRNSALDSMKRASELLCTAQVTGLDEDLRRAMLAHENAANQARHYFYVKGEACEAALNHPKSA